jgi:hypothetical protein
VREPRHDWMTGIDWGRQEWPESLMFGLSIAYVVMFLIVIIVNLGGLP